MNYLAFVKQIGWDKLAGAVVRVVAAVVETIVRLVRSRRREAVAPAEGLRVTILSISTETISVETVEALDEDFSWTAKETHRRTEDRADLRIVVEHDSTPGRARAGAGPAHHRRPGTAFSVDLERHAGGDRHRAGP